MDRQVYKWLSRLLLCVLVLVVWLSCSTESFGQDFEKSMKNAEEHIRKKEYRNAIYEYQQAKIFADGKEEMKEIVNSMNYVVDIYEEIIDSLNVEVEKERKRADIAEEKVRELTKKVRELTEELNDARQRIKYLELELQTKMREAEAHRLAALANRERERGNTIDALRLASLGKELIDTMIDPFITRTFAQAVLAAYGKRLSGQGKGLTSCQFSRNSFHLLAVSRDYSVYVWDTATTTGYPSHNLKEHKDFILSTAFSPNGQYVLTGSADTTARLWELTEDQVVTLTGHSDVVSGVAISPNGNYWLTYSRDGTARLWRHGHEAENPKILMGHQAHIQEADFTADEKFALTRGADSLVIIWDVETGAPVKVLKHQGYIYSAVFSPTIEPPYRVLTTSADCTARLWELQDGEVTLLGELTAHDGFVTDGAFNPKAPDHFVTTSSDQTAILSEWRSDTDTLAFKVLGPHSDWLKKVVFAHDGEHFLTVPREAPIITLWDRQGSKKATLEGHQAKIRAAVFSPGGDRILTASADHTAKLWDLQGNLIMNIPFEGEVTDAHFSPDGKYLLATSLDGTAILCEMPESVYSKMKPSLIVFSEERRKAYGLNDWPEFLCEWLHLRTAGCPNP